MKSRSLQLAFVAHFLAICHFSTYITQCDIYLFKYYLISLLFLVVTLLVKRQLFSIFILIFTIEGGNTLIALKHLYIGAERINSSVLFVKDTERAYKQRKMVTDAFTVRFHMQVRRVRDVYIKSHIYLSIYIYVCKL